MRGISIEERAVKLAQYIIDTKDTVRGAAKKFGISKSTVHMDVTKMKKSVLKYTVSMDEPCLDNQFQLREMAKHDLA